MITTSVAISNRSTVVTDEDVKALIAALQRQVSEDFAPPWGIDAALRFATKDEKPQPDEWVLALLDDSDQADALGYHDVTSNQKPLSKVFVKSTTQDGGKWQVTASHELLEMLTDPQVNLTVFVQNSRLRGRLYAYEVADACEDDQFSYEIDGIPVSDFVFPAWFESDNRDGPFDFQKKITEPFQILPGGYIGVFDIDKGTGWKSLLPNGTLGRVRGRQGEPGSRRKRRATPLNKRVRSTAV